MKSGFTLVELSIVLVIIGLLVGGILIGQTLIESAKINNFVKQIQQYDIAVSLFKSNYKCLPGDCKKISPIGNGDGVISQINFCSSGSLGQDDCFTDEIANFWVHISALNFIKDGIKYSSNAASGIRAGVNVPKAALGKNSGIIVTNTNEPNGVNDYADWPHLNFYHIYNQSESNSNSLEDATRLKNSISAPSALAVDQKIDNGIATTGNVRAVGPTEYTVPLLNSAVGTGCVQSGDLSKYLVNSTDPYPCSLAILLLSQVGQK